MRLYFALFITSRSGLCLGMLRSIAFAIETPTWVLEHEKQCFRFEDNLVSRLSPMRLIRHDLSCVEE